MRRNRIIAVVLLASASVLTGVASTPAAHAQATSGAVTRTETITRAHLNADGSQTVAATNTITLRVAATQNLRGRQQIDVSWSGAHPTGGVLPDENSGDAAKQEYPFVLMECRGVESATTPLTPNTCWTQTWAERYQADFGSLFPAWRLDRYATAGERAQYADQPNPLPATCTASAVADRWVPFVATDGTVFQGGSQGCAGQAPESANVGGNTALPSNTTYGITDAAGTGTAKFDVFTSDENASLGCSYQVACSLVAVPIEGLSCDVAGLSLPADERVPPDLATDADTTCRATGQYTAGQPGNPGIQPDEAVTGSLWWSASNWRNRISVPLTFAQPSSVCSVVTGGTRLDVYGSELMAEASGQWAPYFCTNPALFNLTQVQTAEPEARSLLSSGSIDAAYTSDPPTGGWGRPIVQAPVGITGFAISYAIDDASGQAYDSLRLTPRLLAKLITESYPGDTLVQANYPALSHNPLNLTLDPEFQALNPRVPRLPGNPTASVLLSLSTNSDVVYALTSYLDADPEARAWLDGKADPWGMKVNPHYKHVTLPVSRWTLADPFLLPKPYIDAQTNPCYSASPTPYLGLLASPMATLAAITQRIEFALSNVDTACPNGIPGDVETLNLSTLGREQPGHRFMLALSSLGEVSRYNLVAAALQASSTAPAGRFTTAAGRSFATPTQASLGAAARTLAPDDASGAWNISYSSLRAHSGAYPGTMVVYADIPTKGLPTDEAARYATLLKLASASLQEPGATNGHLPDGYLPITAANGLGGMQSYTAAAASAVEAQHGFVPAPTKARATAPGTTAPGRPSPGSRGGATRSSGPRPLSSSVAPRPTGRYPTIATGSSSPSTKTVAATSSLAGQAIPVVLLVAVASVVASAALRIVPRLRPIRLPSPARRSRTASSGRTLRRKRIIRRR